MRWRKTETDPIQHTVQVGDKIAQLIVEKVALPEVEEVAEIDDTARGEGGFGSTGKT